jgi:hypothetical protein
MNNELGYLYENILLKIEEITMKRHYLFLALFLSTFLISCSIKKQDNSKSIDEKYKEVKVEIIKELS